MRWPHCLASLTGGDSADKIPVHNNNRSLLNLSKERGDFLPNVRRSRHPKSVMGGPENSPFPPNWSTVAANGSETWCTWPEKALANIKPAAISRSLAQDWTQRRRPSWVYGGMAESDAARKAKPPLGIPHTAVQLAVFFSHFRLKFCRSNGD